MSIFKRLDSKSFNESQKFAKAKVSFYGKPFKVEILSKDIVRYNAALISKKLEMTNSKYSTVMKKLVDSCVANGIQKGMKKEDMYIKTISVGRGAYLKRREFKGRGRSGMVTRSFSNVVLEIQEVNSGK